MDRISKLPEGIIETILCLLPIQEAARTSILSKEWRYRWIKIPKLVFHDDTMTTACEFFYTVYKVLDMHQGPIHEFTLSVDEDEISVWIDPILALLARRYNVKMLKLDFNGHYKLPLFLFSSHQLTEMYLGNSTLSWQPPFSGFGSLTTLFVKNLWTSEKMLICLLSRCPLLKRLTLHCDAMTIDASGDSTITDLFECVPSIEYLSVRFSIVLCFVPDKLPKELPTVLVHLKYLCMEDVCLSHKYGLPFLVLLIKSSPNLEKLKLELVGEYCLDEREYGSFTLKDYSDIKLEHLNELEIIDFSNAKIEVDFVKLILSKSHALKKVRIFLSHNLGNDEELQISKFLLSSPCASPMIKIIVRRRSNSS